MQRISTLLQKINELALKEQQAGVIDIDLMLDYTRVLYADLQEWRTRVSFNTSLAMPTNTSTTPAPEAATPMPEIPTSTPAPAETNIASADIPVPVKEETSTTTEQPINHTTTPQGDIRKHIGINDKYQFISELFGNDKEAYEEVLNQVNQSEDYDATIVWLDEIHTERGWNDEYITVQSFYSVLSQFFSER